MTWVNGYELIRCDGCGLIASRWAPKSWRYVEDPNRMDGNYYTEVDMCSGCTKAFRKWLRERLASKQGDGSGSGASDLK